MLLTYHHRIVLGYLNAVLGVVAVTGFGLGQRVGEMLVELAAGVQGHELHAQANAQSGLARDSIQGGQERQFKLLSSGIHRAGLGCA